ncbi:hypothetical protein NDU88_006141 [Pleurodeles waltl]|uniref:Uncharacterized protein n=1 Tax=Pleurodeles waltl TaxID=8319 RepID=A0AAV7SNN1_PLEWA|nr:hypothetical protein NDU88_006141 [Pleurodeles waltl]
MQHPAVETFQEFTAANVAWRIKSKMYQAPEPCAQLRVLPGKPTLRNRLSPGPEAFGSSAFPGETEDRRQKAPSSLAEEG